MGIFLFFFFCSLKMKVSLLLVLLACSFVFAQDEIKLVIDDFTVGGNQQAAVVTLSSDLTASDSPVVDTSSFNQPGCTGLIGCGRDMEMRAFTGFAGRSFESDIFLVSSGDFPAEWAVANPKNSSSRATIQYDGQDSDFDLDINGLGNLDLSVNGEAVELRISAITDLATAYVFTFYSPNGNTCQRSVNIPAITGTYDYEDTIFSTSLDSFSGNCDLENIGAIEVEVSSDDAVDAIIRVIDLIGPANPSSSRTPSSPPSPSTIPSPSPNVFTWYTFDDDDDGASPCADEDRRTYWVEDNAIIYYYFFGIDHPEETTSSASIISAALGFIAAVVFI